MESEFYPEQPVLKRFNSIIYEKTQGETDTCYIYVISRIITHYMFKDCHYNNSINLDMISQNELNYFICKLPTTKYINITNEWCNYLRCMVYKHIYIYLFKKTYDTSSPLYDQNNTFNDTIDYLKFAKNKFSEIIQIIQQSVPVISKETRRNNNSLYDDSFANNKYISNILTTRTKNMTVFDSVGSSSEAYIIRVINQYMEGTLSVEEPFAPFIKNISISNYSEDDNEITTINEDAFEYAGVTFILNVPFQTILYSFIDLYLMYCAENEEDSSDIVSFLLFMNTEYNSLHEILINRGNITIPKINDNTKMFDYFRDGLMRNAPNYNDNAHTILLKKIFILNNSSDGNLFGLFTDSNVSKNSFILPLDIFVYLSTCNGERCIKDGFKIMMVYSDNSRGDGIARGITSKNNMKAITRTKQRIKKTLRRKKSRNKKRRNKRSRKLR